MGLIGATQIIEIVQNYRLCWLMGRFSGGKTSLSFKLAENWLKEGYRLITNAKCVWADDYHNVTLLEDGMLHAVVVIDEGGIYLTEGVQIKRMMAFCAKMDMILLVPSFWEPAQKARVVTIQPISNFKGIGAPLVLYKWRVRQGAFEDKGYFMWWYPNEVYGIYSRQDTGGSPSDIVEHLVKQVAAFESRFGHETNSIRSVEVTDRDREIESADREQEALEHHASILERATKKRGF